MVNHRDLAVKAFEKFASKVESAIPGLIELSDTDDTFDGEQYAKALANIGRAAVHPLLDVLRCDPERPVTRHALLALSQMAKTDIALVPGEVILRHLESPNRRTWEAAASVVSLIDTWTEDQVEYLQSHRWKVRNDAAKIWSSAYSALESFVGPRYRALVMERGMRTVRTQEGK
jgi:hypothetical protein